MIRINLHIDPTVAPLAYKVLLPLNGKQRAARVRMLVEQKLDQDRQSTRNSSKPATPEPESAPSEGILAADIDNVFGGGP